MYEKREDKEAHPGSFLVTPVGVVFLSVLAPVTWQFDKVCEFGRLSRVKEPVCKAAADAIIDHGEPFGTGPSAAATRVCS
jgi:hypothetical protein